jgi:hypothetical protein
LTFLGDPHSLLFWLLWPLTLIWQNYAFTQVSRARNSGSLKRHMVASLQSNGVWFLQTIFVFSAFQNIMSGQYGVLLTIAAVAMYTGFTMLGSLYAHWRALKKETGLSAVGANKKYAQITAEEWESIRGFFAEARAKRAAREAKALALVGTEEKK